MYNKILIGQSTQVLDQGFIQLIDYMGTDDTIVQAARVSFGNEELVRIVELEAASEVLGTKVLELQPVKRDYPGPPSRYIALSENGVTFNLFMYSEQGASFSSRKTELLEELKTKDEVLLRLLMRHNHGTPFEMCEVAFRIQMPMDSWRQMIRHRTANVNEYSTRYTEAIDMAQTTAPDQWRLQSKDNKQGSSGYLTQWPEGTEVKLTEENKYQIVRLPFKSAQLTPTPDNGGTPGGYLSNLETKFHSQARQLYEERLKFGIAKEQARKDLPLSTYTRAYWKCDLRNIFHFLSLRMDSHAQLEIRQYANAMADFIKQLYPVAYKAFEDYQLNAVKFSAMEMKIIKELFVRYTDSVPDFSEHDKPVEMTKREWNEFKSKLGA